MSDHTFAKVGSSTGGAGVEVPPARLAREPDKAALSLLAPQPAPQPASIRRPEDVEPPGVLDLQIDATDTLRGVLDVRMRVPVAGPGRQTLLYPKWMPGYHSPQNPIELFAGLEVLADGERLDWRRDPVEVYAFHVDVPEGASHLEVRFQHLSPTTSGQGEVSVTTDMLLLHWGRMVLYPAGYFARRLQVRPQLRLPQGWPFATALQVASSEDGRITFETLQLDTLVDSPVMAGEHHRGVALDAKGEVELHLFAHEPGDLAATPEQVGSHRELVRQAERLFASRHFDRYRFLVGLTKELGGGGVEHHRCAEILVNPDYFIAWDANYPTRDVFAHEFTHSWNGKFRRGADSWEPSFEEPIRNSLMWLYEGQTQYWGHVLTARSGLWSTDTALEALAKVAGTYDVRPGDVWRTMGDTTRDPIIAGREPLPWPSWQRSEDYYSEGQLMWLEIDTLIRERSSDRRSLDDFASAFFGIDDGSAATQTYTFDDVVRTLDSVVGHDWKPLIKQRLENRDMGAPLAGLERGGYRLVYREARTPFCRSFDALVGQFDLRFSVGLNIGSNGLVQEVMWGGPAFQAGLVAGAQIETVNGQPYSEAAIGEAVDAARSGEPVTLEVLVRGRPRRIVIPYAGGHRFPHLEPIPGARKRLDEILTPR